MELTEEEHQLNRDILTELKTSSPPDVTSILTCYDYDTDADTIYSQMNKFKKSQLQEAANFLQQLPKSRYKEDLIRGIIARIDSLLLESCDKCQEKYSIKIDEIPILACVNCGQGCHAPCYQDLIDVLKSYPGIHFQCHRCEKKKSPEKDSIPPSQENDDAEVDNSQPEKEKDEETQENQHEVNQEYPHDNVDSEKPICQKFRRGKCPHGVSGRTKVNNEVCQFAHPKRCFRFCKNGPFSRYGCHQGRECNYMHPILCKFSLQHRQCTNLKCTFTHLSGTRRYKSDSNYPSDNSDSNYPNEVDSRNSHQKDNHNNSNPHQTSESLPKPQLPAAENSFLELLPGILSQILEDVKQLKQQHSSNPHLQTPKVPPQSDPIQPPNLNPSPPTHQIQNPPQAPHIDQNLKMWSQVLMKPQVQVPSNLQIPQIFPHQMVNPTPLHH